ncbi:MAG TPA: hypothetical protein VNU45_19170, partial [Rummeliibacillus sp.]|nr:hypothetical protein [Rummeliibacillus sp.]
MSLIKKAQEELLLRKRFYEDFPLYARNCLSIRSKNQGLINLILNPAQQYIYDLLMEQKKKTGKIRAVILKGRQQGVSTEIGGLYYWLITHHRGFRAFILTHDSDATKNLYEMVRRYHENCPVLFRPEVGTDNANELNFPLLDSGYKIGTAGNKGVGRSSTIQLFHGSEVPRWPNAEEHAAGILQAIPNSSGTAAIFESTARGVGDYFHLMWQSAVNGSSEFMPIFIPFFWQKEYRAQLKEGFVLTDEEKELVAVYGLDHQQIQWRR